MPAGSSAAQTSSGKVPLTIRLDAPKASSTATRRAPKYISPATTQAVINIEQGGASIAGYPQTQSLSPTGTGCTGTLAGTQCELALMLNPGSYTLTLTAEDASGTALSGESALPFTVVAGQTNQVSLTLGGVPASIVAFPLPNQDASGSGSAGFQFWGAFKADNTTPFSRNVSVLALDADQNIIVGAGAPTITVISNNTGVATVTAATTASPNTFTINPVAYSTSGTTLSATATTTFADSTTASASQTMALTFAARFAPRIYAATSQGIIVMDESGNAVTTSGNFGGQYQTNSGIAYDANANSGNGALFATVQTYNTNYTASYGTPYVFKVQEYDLSGNAIGTPFIDTSPTLNSNMFGITVDPAAQTLYVGEQFQQCDCGNASNDETVEYSETGTYINEQSTTGAVAPFVIPASATGTGLGAVIAGAGPYGANYAFTTGLTANSSVSFAGSSDYTSGTYDPLNGDVYLAGNYGYGAPELQVYPATGGSAVATGVPNVPGPTFYNGAMANPQYDPANGNIYLAGAAASEIPTIAVYSPQLAAVGAPFTVPGAVAYQQMGEIALVP